MPFWVRSALPLATERTQECIWNLSYNERRMTIELEIGTYAGTYRYIMMPELYTALTQEKVIKEE